MSRNLAIADQSEPAVGFITRWTVSGDATARTITLPLPSARVEGALAYDCIIDWGDGSPTSHVTAYDDPNRIHTYALDGTYNVEIRGTCEGWNFNNGGDCLKIVAVVNWGTSAYFNGFKSLLNAFYGCSNLTSLGVGTILASGSGVLQGFALTFALCKMASIPPDLFMHHTNVTTHAFENTFLGCSALTSIPKNLFKYNILASDYAFMSTFNLCTSLASIPPDLFRYNTQAAIQGFYATFRGGAFTSIPTDLFRYNTLVSGQGFNSTFYQCTSLASIPTDLFRYNTLTSGAAFQQTFYGCTSLTSLPADLFKYNPLPALNGFRSCFYQCTSLASIPADLFRYNTAVADTGFRSTFNGCSSLTAIPADLFRYNTAVSTGGFQYTFYNCTSLASVPADLFRYNTACNDFSNVFNGCVKLQVPSNLFYEPGEETTRFLGQAMIFDSAFSRNSFSGIQGTAPNLWECDFGESITLSTAPAADWDPGDTITGQSSGATAVVVSKTSSLTYKIKQHLGTFTLGEIVGVTGVPTKLAVQDGTSPTFSGTPSSAGCFGGAGNSPASLNNYASIPSQWE